MSSNVKFAISLIAACAISTGAAAHFIGENHAHPSNFAWVDYAVALLAVGLGSAFAARHAGADGTLRHGAVWVTRACALGIVLCAVVAVL